MEPIARTAVDSGRPPAGKAAQVNNQARRTQGNDEEALDGRGTYGLFGRRCLRPGRRGGRDLVQEMRPLPRGRRRRQEQGRARAQRPRTDARAARPPATITRTPTRTRASPGTRRPSSTTSRIRKPRFPAPRWCSPASRTKAKRRACGPSWPSSRRTARSRRLIGRRRCGEPACAGSVRGGFRRACASRTAGAHVHPIRRRHRRDRRGQRARPSHHRDRRPARAGRTRLWPAHERDARRVSLPARPSTCASPPAASTSSAGRRRARAIRRAAPAI